MIKLDVKDYCQDCPYFEPECITKPRHLYSNDKIAVTVGDTIITCEHRIRCERVEKIIGRNNAVVGIGENNE